MLRVEEERKVLLVQITADRGLCGGFNSNLNRRAEAFIRDMNGKGIEVDLVNVGRKGHDYFRRRRLTIVERFLNVMNDVSLELAQKVADVAAEKFVAGEYQAAYILYNRFRSAAAQVLTLRKLLPISTDGEGAPRNLEYLYEPSEEDLLSRILPMYLVVQLHAGLLDSVASEQGARMTAMEAATSNAEEMIYRLTLKLNRLRQESITKELMEIVGGAEALKG
jgi:F-type H+-transporting ATPase subunit gamma